MLASDDHVKAKLIISYLATMSFFLSNELPIDVKLYVTSFYQRYRKKPADFRPTASVRAESAGGTMAR